MKYLFLDGECDLSQALPFEQVHVYCGKHHVPLQNLTLSNPQIYMYCFNLRQLQYCQTMCFTPHICIEDGNIFSKTLDDFANIYNIVPLEKFWILSDSYIKTVNKSLLRQRLKDLGHLWCFNISPIFIHNTDYTALNSFIGEFKEWSHPSTISYGENYYLKGNILTPLILGLFGDLPLSINGSQNLKALNRNKLCMQCDNYPNCLEAKTGAFMMEYNKELCWGPKLIG